MKTLTNAKDTLEKEIDNKSLLTLNGSLVTGLLFFFALGRDVPGQKLILFLAVLPFVFFLVALTLALRNRTKSSCNITFVGSFLLIVSITLISIDSFI
jgi:hypothetical protein